MLNVFRLSCMYIWVLQLALVNNVRSYPAASMVSVTSRLKGRSGLGPIRSAIPTNLVNSRSNYKNAYHIQNHEDLSDTVSTRQQPYLARHQNVDADEFRPLPYPVDFHFYDRDNNGFIDIHELIDVTGMAEHVDLAFAASDANGDNQVDEKEYNQVPWGYEADSDVVLQQ